MTEKPRLNELKHFGVLGMKWGVRRYQNYDGSLTREGARRLNRKWTKSHNQAAAQMNRSILPEVNSKYANKDKGATHDKPFDTKAGQQYIKEIDKKWRSAYVNALKINNPELFILGENWVNDAPMMNVYANYIYKDY